MEKVTLGRGHQVREWLIEGLTALAYGAQPQSAKELRTAVGLPTAFEILAIQAKYSLLGRFTDGARGVTFSLSDIKCRHCFDTVFEEPLTCPGVCGRDLAIDGTQNVYVIYGCATLRSDSSKLGLWFSSGAFGCLECGRRVMSRPGVWCSSCGEDCGNGEIFVGPSRRSVEYEIKTVFRDEIASYPP